MFRDAPAPREPHVAVRVRIPRRLVDQLTREAAAQRSPLATTSQVRDQIVTVALDSHFATRCTTNPQHSRTGS